MSDKTQDTRPGQKRPLQGRMIVRVKADEVHDNEDGTFNIAIPARPLSEDDITRLREYFPTLFPTAMGLFHKEALLQSVVVDF